MNSEQHDEDMVEALTEALNHRRIGEIRRLYVPVVDKLKYTSQFDRAERLAVRTLELVTGRGDQLRGRCLYDLAYVSLMKGQYRDALAQANRALKPVGASKDVKQHADALWLRAECLRMHGRNRDALLDLKAASSLYRQLSLPPSWDNPGQLWVLWNTGRISTTLSEFKIALRAFDELENLAEVVGLQEAIGCAAWGRGRVELYRGNLSAATHSFQRAFRPHEEEGDNYWSAFSRWALAETALQRGEVARVEPILTGVERFLRQARNFQELGFVRLTRAGALLYRGRFLDARRIAESALGQASFYTDPYLIARAELILAATDYAEEAATSRQGLLSKRSVADSRRLAKRAYQRSVRFDNVYFAQRSLLLQGELSRATGDFAAATEVLKRVGTDAKRYGHQIEMLASRLSLEECARFKGQAKAANYRKLERRFGQLGSFLGAAYAVLARDSLDSPGRGTPLEQIMDEAAGHGVRLFSLFTQPQNNGKPQSPINPIVFV